MASKPTVSTGKIVSAVANKFNELPKKITRQVISEFLATIESEMTAGSKLRLEKLGILQVKNTNSRRGRNPLTGEEITIAASKKIAFRASKTLKEQIGVNKARKTAKK
jgi:DNA-binding protein HU-beta